MQSGCNRREKLKYKIKIKSRLGIYRVKLNFLTGRVNGNILENAWELKQCLLHRSIPTLSLYLQRS